MVQLLNYPVLQAFNFTVVYSCPDNSSDCPEVQEVLVSVVGIEVNGESEAALKETMRLCSVSRVFIIYPTSVQRIKPWLHFMWPH